MIESKDYEKSFKRPIGEPMNPNLHYPLSGPVDYSQAQNIRVINIRNKALEKISKP